jgi:membrane-associated protein
MELIQLAIDFILHVDDHLQELINAYGSWTYAILFLIVFCETGLVITPFLPGDSLLFAAGALTVGTTLNVHLLVILLITAAIIGDAVNYTIGRFFGEKLFANPESRIFRQDYLRRTEAFYEKYGGATIIIARFLPILRTFAPFVAGMGKMSYQRFAFFNVVGAVLWVVSFTYAGHFFGNLPVVKENFTLLIFGIIIVSVMPMVIAGARAWWAARQA